MCFPLHLHPLYREAKELLDGSGAWKTELRQGRLLPAKGTRGPKETYPVRRARQKHHQMVSFSINFQYALKKAVSE